MADNYLTKLARLLKSSRADINLLLQAVNTLNMGAKNYVKAAKMDTGAAVPFDSATQTITIPTVSGKQGEMGFVQSTSSGDSTSITDILTLGDGWKIYGKTSSYVIGGNYMCLSLVVQATGTLPGKYNNAIATLKSNYGPVQSIAISGTTIDSGAGNEWANYGEIGGPDSSYKNQIHVNILPSGAQSKPIVYIYVTYFFK